MRLVLDDWQVQLCTKINESWFAESTINCVENKPTVPLSRNIFVE